MTFEVISVSASARTSCMGGVGLPSQAKISTMTTVATAKKTVKNFPAIGFPPLLP